MKKLILLFLLLPLTIFTFAQPPAGYYNAAVGLYGETLQATLHNIIDNHQVQSYSSLHTHFEVTDRKSNNTVWDMYSDIPGGTPPYVYHFTSGDQCGNYSREGDCYNREHSWPKSWFNNQSPMNSDLFHLYPTDGYVNGKRSNFPFGEVSSASWTSKNGSKLGSCSYSGYSGTVFEPIDAYKGDFARTYFYMSTRYYHEDNGWAGSPMVNGAQLRPWALAMMIKWHEADPVSQKEIDRNNAVYEIQLNRNPFIDHPEYVANIWGDPTGIYNIAINRNIRVYPIPATEVCVIDHNGFYDKDKVRFTLSDVTGKVYHCTYTIDEHTLQVDVSSLSHGFYIASIAEDGKSPAYARIVK
jgi:endonuclease I